MYVYGKHSQDSVHARRPMTNSKYILGPGTRKRISPYRFNTINDILDLDPGLDI